MSESRVQAIHRDGELELVKKLLEDERGRAEHLRSRLVGAEAKSDAIAVAATVESVPGVEPRLVVGEYTRSILLRLPIASYCFLLLPVSPAPV